MKKEQILAKLAAVASANIRWTPWQRISVNTLRLVVDGNSTVAVVTYCMPVCS